jgi:hypothetical protein
MPMQPELHPAPLAQPDPGPGERPAAETIAQVTPLRAGREIHLPPRFARAAVENWLTTCGAVFLVIEGPCDAGLTGRALGIHEWAIRLSSYRWDPKLRAHELQHVGAHVVFIYPKHRVILAASSANHLLQALERVKPEELDAEGRPLPWVLVRYGARALGAGERDDDAVLLEAHEPLPPIDQDEFPDPDEEELDDTAARARAAELVAPIRDEEIRGWFEALCRIAKLSPSLSLARGTVNKLGFTTGRVWSGRDGVPRRVHLTTCPGSDAAEILATIVHELAHPLARARDHGDGFKLAMISLAEARFGPPWFVEARRLSAERHHLVDSWIASGIRAALRGAPVPLAKVGDDGQMARVLTKIRKLRELGADQLGLPEGISATAMANDLITAYGLGGYSVRIDAGIEAQMIDRWVPLQDGAVWRRSLAHGIAKASDVFALALPKLARMHFFGTYAAVVGAEYLFSVTEAQIGRECERHLGKWKESRRAARGRDAARGGDTVRERISFCDAAVLAFCKKLELIVREESAAVGETRHAKAPSAPLEAAEEFAHAEHEKRGSGWTSGARRATRENESGTRAGRALEILRGGLDSTGAQLKLKR